MSIGGGTFLQPALQPVFDLVFSEGVELFVKLTGGELKGTLVQWERELLFINNVLDDAVRKQFQSKAVQTWLRELQDLAFDMEDILDDFSVQAQEPIFHINIDQGGGEVGQVVISAINNMVASFSDGVSTLCNTISPDIQSKIEGINKRLSHIKTDTQYFHPSTTNNMQQQQTLQTESLRSHRESSSIVSESKVFGRDEKKQEIITRLLFDDDLSTENNYTVIPIIGKGGIGKTTLAQCVYNDEQVKGHFSLMAWVCVSDVFDVKRITTKIIKADTESGTLADLNTLDEAQTQLKQILIRNKFLIVLDDIWNEEYHGWSQLQTPFNHAVKGSRVIMTTRNEVIARMMINHRPSQNTIIRVKGLYDDEIWNLFQQHVNGDSSLDEVKNDIIEKCKGLPLAAKSLGGLFKKTMDNRERRMILESNIWSEESDILPVLRLSYDYLPAQLKHTFAYMSLYPKDYKFKKEEVILLWMAQGYLQDDGHMEDLGQNYFTYLESRSLFEQCPYDEGFFSMHDLIHDLALWAADGICYAMGSKNITRVDKGRIRHVFHTKDATMHEGQLIASKVRTFYDDGNYTDLDFVQRCTYIRALRLSSKEIEVLPEYIGDLKHLRFLCLNFSRIKELPKSISKLWNLQSLCLEGCSDLKEVPDIGSLKKLCHLDISKTSVHRLPEDFEKLKSLKVGEFILEKGHGFRIRELKNLNSLQGRLRISGLENVIKVEDAKEAELHEKCGLDDLYLNWGVYSEEVDDDIKREVVEQLKPPTSIKVCWLKGYMGLTLPSWFGDAYFNKMTKIILEGCKKCERLPPLGQLPCLKRLEIWGMSSIKQIGVEFYGCSNAFPALECLEFRHMECWEKWEHMPGDDNRAFPCLETLHIGGCDSLRTLEMYECQDESESYKPLLLLPSLNFLNIRYCCNIESLPSEMHNYTSLQYIQITQCPKLQCFLEGRFPKNLRFLYINNAQINGEWGLHHLHSLVHLELDSCVRVAEEFNLSFSSSSSSLCKLIIKKIQNLKNLSVSGTNLNKLIVDDCKNIESLVGNFTSLEQLELHNCPKLTNMGSITDASGSGS